MHACRTESVIIRNPKGLHSSMHSLMHACKQAANGLLVEHDSDRFSPGAWTVPLRVPRGGGDPFSFTTHRTIPEPQDVGADQCKYG